MDKKILLRTVAYGALSAGIYAAVFYDTSAIMPYFTAGSYLSVLPIATVFAVSFVHGAFASSLWSLLGIEAIKPVKESVSERPMRRSEKRQRPRLRLNT
jgi:hypothetical protein